LADADVFIFILPITDAETDIFALFKQCQFTSSGKRNTPGAILASAKRD